MAWGAKSSEAGLCERPASPAVVRLGAGLFGDAAQGVCPRGSAQRSVDCDAKRLVLCRPGSDSLGKQKARVHLPCNSL